MTGRDFPAAADPDPAEVEELAEQIYAEVARRGEGYGGIYRVAARTALRWMRDREGAR